MRGTTITRGGSCHSEPTEGSPERSEGACEESRKTKHHRIRSLSCHPERAQCHPERAQCHPERSEGSSDNTRRSPTRVGDDRRVDLAGFSNEGGARGRHR